jgi:hypothetical protein
MVGMGRIRRERKGLGAGMLGRRAAGVYHII